MEKFNVGDIVIGNDLADEMYSITCKGTLWEVLRVGVDCISIGNTDDGEFNSVESKAFDLYKPVDYKFKQGDKVKIAPNVYADKHYNDITLLDGMLFNGVREISKVVPAGYYVEGFCYSSTMLIPDHPVTSSQDTSSQDTSSPRFCTGDTATLTDCNGNTMTVVIQGVTEKGCVIKQVSKEIEIGDTVEITDIGESYTTAFTLFKEITSDMEESVALELAFKYAYNCTPSVGCKYTVKGKTDRPRGAVYLIVGDRDGWEKTYIIGEEGVKKVVE